MNGAVDLQLGEPDLTFRAAGDTLVRRTVLPSGIRVLTEQVPGSRSATIGFWVAVGSRDEHPADSGHPATFGSTHFLEHLLFKGTGTRSALDIAVAVDAVGGEHNAVTAKEYTCYYAKVQDRDLPMAVDVLADMFTSSVLDVDDFESERGVILEELAMAGDDPADVANERFFEAVLGSHPLARPIGGDAHTIGAATRDAVREHYRACYRAPDLVVTAAGAVDHDELVAGLSAALVAAGWDLEAVAPPVDRRATEVALLEGRAPLTVVERPGEQAHLVLGVPGLVATDERRSVLSVLSTIFGGGMSSRLFQQIREQRGLAYAVYSFAPGYSDAGVFGMYAGCAPKNAATVAALMRTELERLAHHGVTDEELARATGYLGGASALALEDSDTRMSRLGRAELALGEFSDLDEALRRVGRVTADDVRALATELAARPFSLAAVGPVDEWMFRSVVDSPEARPVA
ncbi:M16 family metallopeptidase [Agromyces marinus]|uniref:Zinc protease n=1 Tax=Agromyces marinus TaxID=1389020 RepID=A0ABN6YDL1_9MICO|nr:pitrilysin family protein [Agromyces marinus]UIP58300.1 putative zinc protease [Agromyces marinus]BDZ53453.1 putative zinc protease [Agromyces marinus]